MTLKYQVNGADERQNNFETRKCVYVTTIFNSWPHTHHPDRRLGVSWGHVEFVQRTLGLGYIVVVIGVGRRFKDRVSFGPCQVFSATSRFLDASSNKQRSVAARVNDIACRRRSAVFLTDTGVILVTERNPGQCSHRA